MKTQDVPKSAAPWCSHVMKDGRGSDTSSYKYSDDGIDTTHFTYR